jgi:glycosyltransferase involved in cell wall biosynthesis
MISVLLPTYNRSEYLAEAIDSIINQTEKDWELIVVDDGSTDSTSTLMAYYTKTDPRIKYFPDVKNRGIAHARNRALSLSEGEVVAVMDSDDLCSPDRLKRSLKELSKGADLVYSSYLRADEAAKVIDGVKPPKPREITKESLLKDQGIPHVTIVAKRQVFLDNPYNETHTVNDDYQFVVNVLKSGCKLAMISDPLMIVRFHKLNTSKTEDTRIKEVSEEVRKGIRES